MAYTVADFFLYLLIIIIIKESLASATLTLKVSSATLQSSGDTLRVSWTSLESPTEIDWLGIYTPSESSDEHYIGYVLLSSVPGWESGNGSYAFPAGKVLTLFLIFNMYLICVWTCNCAPGKGVLM